MCRRTVHWACVQKGRESVEYLAEILPLSTFFQPDNEGLIPAQTEIVKELLADPDSKLYRMKSQCCVSRCIRLECRCTFFLNALIDDCRAVDEMYATSSDGGLPSVAEASVKFDSQTRGDLDYSKLTLSAIRFVRSFSIS